MNSIPPATMLTFAVTLSITSIPETHCPSIPQSKQYATSETENEACFYNPSVPIQQMPCMENHFRSAITHRCTPCPENTFQPKKNNCPQCIQCKDCAKDGMMVKLNCTGTENTECMDHPSIFANITTPKDDIETRSSSFSPNQRDSSSTTATMHTNRSNPGSKDHPTHNPAVQHEHVAWIMWMCSGITIFALVIAVVAFCHHVKKTQKKTKKLKKENLELKEQLKKTEQEDRIDGKNSSEVASNNCNNAPGLQPNNEQQREELIPLQPAETVV